MKRLKICSLITAALMTVSMTAQGSCLIANADDATEKVAADTAKEAETEVKAEEEVEKEAEAEVKAEEEVEKEAEAEVKAEEEVEKEAEVEVKAEEEVEKEAEVEADDEVVAIAEVAEKSSSDISVRLENVGLEESTSQMSFSIVVTNESDAPLDLSKLELSYFYTINGDAEEQFYCDYAGTIGGNYKGLTQFVKGSTSDYAKKAEGADKELKVSFGSGAGELEAGQQATIQIRLVKDNYNWQNKYDQSDDFSFNNSDNVAGYIDGELVCGAEPDGEIVVKDAKISPENATYDKQAPSEVSVKMTLNGHELNAISDEERELVAGEDYELAGTKVTFTQSYLDSLNAGNHSITFDFDGGKDRTFELTVKDDVVILKPEISSVSGVYNKKLPTEVNVGVTLNGHELTKIMNGSVELVAGTDYVVDGTKVTFTKDYLDSLAAGVHTLTFVFSDGTQCKYKLTIEDKVEKNTIYLEIGSAEGKPGDTIKIPVTAKGINEYGLNVFGMTIHYDNTKFENVSLEPVNIPNPDKSFAPRVNEAKGEIRPYYYNTTKDDDPAETIFDDGVLFNIVMTIKEDAAGGETVIENVDKGKFGFSSSPEKLESYKVVRSNGTVVIDSGIVDVKENKISPASISFKKGEAKDTKVTVSGNALNGIYNGSTELKEGVDYKVTDTGVTLLKGYLNDLKEGQTNLKFDFAEGKDLTLKVNVEGVEVVNEITPSEISFTEGEAVDTAVSYSGSKLVGIKNNSKKLVEGSDYTIANGEVTFTAEYLNSLKAGNVKLTFDFETGKDQILNVNVDAKDDTLSIVSSDMEVKPGETVKVAVNVKNVPANGISAFGLNIQYDTEIFEDVKYEDGDVVKNAGMDVFGDVRADEGMIYYNAAAEDSFVNKSGTVVYLILKVKDGAKSGTTKLTVTGDSAITNGDYMDQEAKYSLGNIVVK